MLLISLALASEVTRDSYREAVEPICKANTEANERILKGVRAEVRHGEFKTAAAKFTKAAAALKKALAQLRAVRQPNADKAKLAKWLARIKEEAGLFEAVAAKLRAGNKGAAEEKVVRLTHNADLANNVVIGFEFEYCRFEPSRFT
jgi:Asp-tRNA(Asn)/Glu-tRNA(Gln) amidotransferase A subunit family amidase